LGQTGAGRSPALALNSATRGATSSDSLGPTDWLLIAVLTFDDADAKSIASTTKAASPGGARLEPEPWFPPDVQALLRSKARPLDASAFFKPPLLHGRLVYLEGTSIFVLSHYTM